MRVTPASAAEAPAEDKAAVEAADQFYSTLIRLEVRGLPTEEQMKVLGPLLSPELNELIAKARKEQQEFIRKNPDEKPPWIEGNLFGSLFEGVHTFSLGKPVLQDAKASFPVYLEYREGKETSRWIDVLVLERAGAGWLVRDIFLNGPWDFKAGDSLRQVLSAG